MTDSGRSYSLIGAYHATVLAVMCLDEQNCHSIALVYVVTVYYTCTA